MKTKHGINFEESGIGEWLYDDVIITQSKNIISSLASLKAEIINRSIKIDNIIEIGTYFGGFTLLLNDIFCRDSTVKEIHSFDISDYYRRFGANIHDVFRSRPSITFYSGDVFGNQQINTVINSGRCILICDGGNKPKEFNYYSQFLKSGDIIMAHDYARDDEDFKDRVLGKIWNCKEIQYADIQSAVLSNQLKPFVERDMANSAMCCFQKE